jgi:Peptidase family M41
VLRRRRGPAVTEQVDQEVERIVNHAYVRCKEILTNNRDLLEKLARRLLEVESVTAEELGMMIMEQGDNLWMAPYGGSPVVCLLPRCCSCCRVDASCRVAAAAAVWIVLFLCA